MNILLTLILAVNLLFFVVFLVVLYLIWHNFKRIIAAPDDKTPSPLAQTMQVIVDMLARSLVAQVKSTFMGKQSGDKRAEAAIMADIAEDALADKAPLVSAVLDSFPSIKKTLRRNPALLQMALEKLGSSGFGKQAATSSGDNGASQIKFKL